MLVRTYYTNRNETARPTWTESGAQLINTKKYKEGYDSSKLRKKTTKNVEQSTLDMISWKNDWDEYVRENVVSNAAAKLITRFLLNTMAATATAADGAQSEADASGIEDELPPMKLSGIKFQKLIKSVKDDGSLAEKCNASTEKILRT